MPRWASHYGVLAIPRGGSAGDSHRVLRGCVGGFDGLSVRSGERGAVGRQICSSDGERSDWSLIRMFPSGPMDVVDGSARWRERLTPDRPPRNWEIDTDSYCGEGAWIPCCRIECIGCSDGVCIARPDRPRNASFAERGHCDGRGGWVRSWRRGGTGCSHSEEPHTDHMRGERCTSSCFTFQSVSPCEGGTANQDCHCGGHGDHCKKGKDVGNTSGDRCDGRKFWQ